MKNLYSILFAAASMMPLSASAGFDLPEENSVLQSEDYGYRLEKNYDFVGGNFNGQPMSVSGDGCFVLSADKADFKLNRSFDVFQVTAPVEMTNFYIQIGTGAINLRSGVGKDGLHNYGSGGRWFAMSDMREGQILVLQITEGKDSKGNTTTIKPNVAENNDKTAWADVLTDPLQVEDITDAIHEIQDQADADEDGEPDGIHDAFRYWKVLTNGFIYVDMERNTSIQGMQIWAKNDEPEAVTAPSIKMVGVNGDARNIEFKPGESTYGNEVKTYYAFEGADPVYLKDSEEVDHYEYTYELDGDGNPVIGEDGNPVIIDQTPVYKKVLDMDAVAEAGGEFGDYVFNPEDGSVAVSAGEDEDGDGVVIIKYASVSSEGTVSQIMTTSMNIGEIQLNAPTLSLVSFSGFDRTYKIGWANNTLCGEDYMFVIETGEGGYSETEANVGIGELVSSAKSIKVTVKVEGYADGIGEIAEVDVKDVDVKVRTDLGNGQNEEHNWDFCTLTQEVLEMVSGKIIDHYELLDENGEVVETYTVEEVESGQGPKEEELAKVFKYFGWDGEQSGKSRCWRTWIPEYEVVDGEQTETIINSVYAEDQTGLLKGLVADNSHPNYSSMCIYVNNAGLYYMSKGTIVVENVAYGEYVAVTTNTGTTITQYLDTENPFTFSVKQDTYVHSIDVYTYDNLPDNVECITAPGASQRTAVYTIGGVEVKTPAKGINIIRKADGSRIKVVF